MQVKMLEMEVKRTELQVQQQKLQVEKLRALKEAQSENGEVRTMLLDLLSEVFA